jgi:hypothetical protein
MAEPRGGEIIDARGAPAGPPARRSARRLAVLGLALWWCAGAGCAGRYRGPRTLATLGGALVVGGSATWVAGERGDGRAATGVGFALVVAGIASVIASGGWMAKVIACTADPDCDESEQCHEIPAPPGGIPYKQCIPR